MSNDRWTLSKVSTVVEPSDAPEAVLSLHVGIGQGDSIAMNRDLMMRHLRRISAFTLITGMVVSFQNCGPAPQNTLCPQGQICSSDQASSATSRPGGSSGSGSGGSVGGTGGSGSSSGSTGGGFGDGSGGTGGSGGGGTGGGSTGGGFGDDGGGTGGSGGGGTGTPIGTHELAFAKNLPSNKSVMEGATYTLEISVQGGEWPYTYQWYKDGAKLTDYAATFQAYADTADRFTKEGNYYVIVKDKAGNTIRSQTLNLSFQIPIVGCAAGQYTANGGNPLASQGVRPISDLYVNGRGKYMIPANHPDIYFFSSAWSYYGFYLRSLSRAYDHGDNIDMPCGYLPNIDDNMPSQCRGNSWRCSSTGRIRVVCENKKLRLVSNTCQWTYNDSGD